MHRNLAVPFPVRQQHIVQLHQELFSLAVRRQSQQHAFRPALDHTIDVQHVLHVHGPGADKIVVPQRTTHNHDLILDQQVPELLERFAEQADLHTAAIVIQHDADAVSAFANVDHQTRDSHLAPRLRIIASTSSGLRWRLCGKINQIAVDETARVRAHRVEGMPGEV